MQEKKKKLIDPVTGLELTEVDPSPDQHKVMLDTLASPDAPTPAPPAAQPAAVPDLMTQPAAARTPNTSLLDKVLFGIFGTPDSKLEGSDPQALRERQGRRRDASQLSKNAAEDPGEAFMGIPTTGGKGLGESLDGPLSFMASLAKTLIGGG
jgi:hypothetical protein